MPRNPKWSREELMLALELYFKVNPSHASPAHPEVRKVSVLLNQLPHAVAVADSARYRNPNGVYMKMCNFLRLDPDYPGSGLSRGGKLEESIWKEFASDRERLSIRCDEIRAAVVRG